MEPRRRHIAPLPCPRFIRVATLALFLLNSQTNLKSQDIHFSQIDVNTILFIPAYSGFFDGTGRFGVVYRNQWASVSKAFQTVAATAEFSLLRRRYYRDGFNIGTILYSDKAGTLHYGTTAGNIVLSYYKSIGRNNNNFISIALEAGFGQAGFSTADISMEDPTDDIGNLSANFLTIGAGAAWFYQPNDDFYFKAGASGRNLNRPDISYLNLQNAYIERKISTYMRAEYRHWGNLSVLPLLAMMFQKNYTEVMFGADAKWFISESGDQTVSLMGGIHYRWRDAALVEMVFEYNAFLFALTYDANISKLTPATNTFGSFEIGIVYRMANKKHVKRKAMPCPIIM